MSFSLVIIFGCEHNSRVSTAVVFFLEIVDAILLPLKPSLLMQQEKYFLEAVSTLCQGYCIIWVDITVFRSYLPFGMNLDALPRYELPPLLVW